MAAMTARKAVVSAAALALRSMAKSSGPLSALERAEGQDEREGRERNEEEKVLRVDEAALERVEVLFEAELSENTAENVRHVLPELPHHEQGGEDDERDEKRDALALGDTGHEEPDGD